MSHIRVDRRDAVGLITFARPEKRNAFTLEMFRLLTEGFGALEADHSIRAVVVTADGPDFTAGLDLMDVGPSFMQGTPPFPGTAIDPWDVFGRPRTKPLVVA